MKKTLVISLMCAALVCAFALPSLYAVDAPADMELHVPDGAKATKSPVPFSHKGHASLECKTCHHKWDGKGDIKGCASEGCHTDMKDKRGDNSYYKAFHDRSETSCMGCHKALKKAKKDTGPTSCTQCHPKKK